jgi:hypothetical protein
LHYGDTAPEAALQGELSSGELAGIGLTNGAADGELPAAARATAAINRGPFEVEVATAMAAKAALRSRDLVFIDLYRLNGFSVSAPMNSGSEAVGRVLKNEALILRTAPSNRAVTKRTDMFAFIVAQALPRA